MPSNIINSGSEVVSDFYLYQNYPNPFNPSTQINFDLRITDYVTLKVYDAIGNEIAVLAEGKFSPGGHSVTFDASLHNASSGIYFYRLTTDNQTITKKMVMVK